MPTHDEKQKAHRYIDRAEELFRHSASACAVAGGMGISTMFFDSDAWVALCVLAVAIGLHLAGHAYLRAAAGLRMR